MPCCCTETITCDACDPGPLEFSAVGSGFVFSACCFTFNDTFILDFVPAQPVCTWRYDLPSTVCGDYDEILITISSSGGDWYLTVRLPSTPSFDVSWRVLVQTGTDPFDCTTIAALDVPFFTAGVLAPCQDAGSKWVVSAV